MHWLFTFGDIFCFSLANKHEQIEALDKQTILRKLDFEENPNLHRVVKY